MIKLNKNDLYVKDFKSLKIDKELDHVAYNDNKHVYFNKNTGEKYISVTTLIHSYVNEFDGEYWSKYKAIEKFITRNTPDEEKKSYFNQYKKQAGGHSNVIPYFEETIIKGDPKRIKILETLQNQVKEEWKESNRQSLIKGTNFHKKKEDYYTERCEAYYNSILYKVVKNNQMMQGGDYGIYPELLIYNDEYKIAGQADLVIRTKDKLTIRDYKTNKELKMSNNFQKMKYPLSNFDDCAFNHYQLQLSLYGYMLSHNYNLEVKDLIIDHHPDDVQNYSYPCQYLYDSIELILEDYKKTYNKILNS